ncbi:MAG: type VI secretion system tip protein VgrG, partial [Deltaproteobacteria bacterium]|nr:type VI secretion system tip protein VgrG [Deltaproteobacteria bacterium]
MAHLQLLLESGEESLRVVRFRVHEGISRPFEICAWALSPDASIPFEAIVGRAAEFRLVSAYRHVRRVGTRRWSGICRSVELVQAEPVGQSTYCLHIVPQLWLLTRRSTQRIFQHQSIPDIVGTILAQWRVEHRWAIDAAFYPRFEYRVQYAESDFDFVSRLLEEAGIAYYFHDPEAEQEPGEDALFRGRGVTRLVLSDRLHAAPRRAGPPLPFVDHPGEAAEQEYVTEVQLSEEVRPGRLTMRDFDFRLRPDHDLSCRAEVPAGAERAHEQYRYLPGAFRVVGQPGGSTPVADDKAAVRTNTAFAEERVARSLASERADRRQVRFVTNAVDLHPGTVFAMQHPRGDLDETALLATELWLEGDLQQEWLMAGAATFAAKPYRPPFRTPRPRALGVQSAMVVGPAGEEIHADELGRVRVQFHWDREGTYDDGSSLWVRVSQGWAGPGFGRLTLPRVGQEVLVQFEGGDPDRPVVVGRLFNATAMAPYELPAHQTKSVWRSASSPGGGGFNELSFEDAAGRERVYLQAERNLDQLVKQDETHLVRGSLRATVAQDCDLVVKVSQRERVEQDRQLHVAGDRRERFARDCSCIVGAERHVRVAERDALEAGTEIHLKAGQKLVLEAGERVSITGRGGFIDIGPEGVTIQGTLVKINSGGAAGSGHGARPAAPEEARLAVVQEPGAVAPMVPLAPTRRLARAPLRPAVARPRGRGESGGEPGERAAPDGAPRPARAARSWIEIALVDAAGRPVPGVRYEIVLPDGSTARGRLDGRGLAHVASPAPG